MRREVERVSTDTTPDDTITELSTFEFAPQSKPPNTVWMSISLSVQLPKIDTVAISFLGVIEYIQLDSKLVYTTICDELEERVERENIPPFGEYGEEEKRRLTTHDRLTSNLRWAFSPLPSLLLITIRLDMGTVNLQKKNGRESTSEAPYLHAAIATAQTP